MLAMIMESQLKPAITGGVLPIIVNLNSQRMDTMTNLFDSYITEQTEDGLVNGLVKMITDGWNGNLSPYSLMEEFPGGPEDVVYTFRSRYPDVELSDTREILQKVDEKIDPIILRKIEEQRQQDPIELMLQQILGNVNSTGYVTAPKCNNPDCKNPDCPNYKGGRKSITGKNKIGYIN